MGEPEITGFLSHLATHQHVSASTQNQALAALLFLYERVLNRELDWLAGVVHAKRPDRLPVVLSRDDVKAVLERMEGVARLMGALLYGSGLRVLECAKLRVKDLDFDRHELTVRDGKGRKDRVTMLPGRLDVPLRAHLAVVRELHEVDLAAGSGVVALPDALDRKYPGASRLALAVAVSCQPPLRRSSDWSEASPPCPRNRSPTCRRSRRHGGQHRQARDRPHPASQLRHAPA